MKHNCPICRKAVDSASDPNFPFCSERCRLLDLGNWAAEKYRVAVPIMDESEREETETNERAADQGPEQGKE